MNSFTRRIVAADLAWPVTALTLAHAATPVAESIPAAQCGDKAGGQFTVMQQEVIG